MFRQRILASTIQVPWVIVLQDEARTRSTHSSTAIEGNPLHLDDVRLLAHDRPVLGASERSRREIANQLGAFRFIEKHQRKKNITRGDLCALHTRIADGVMDQGLAGRYRTFDVRVGSYVPPTFKKIPALMREYLAWWHRESAHWSPVISSAIVHYQFEAIHPFGDGNGRMGRALAMWDLYRRGFDSQHLFSVDEVYWEGRARYYAQLDAVRKARGDLTGWLEYCAEALHITLERVLARIAAVERQHRAGAITLTATQEKLLHLLHDQGSMAPSDIWRALRMTKQGAMKIIGPLLAHKLICRVGTRKMGKYMLAELRRRGPGTSRREPVASYYSKCI